MASNNQECDMTTYYGKYRGSVVDNVDPLLMGRVLVTVPALDLPGAWAMPCFPLSGNQAGAWLIPSPGTGVWVEFEQGEVDSPIWSGCWYGSAAEVPPQVREAPPATPPIVLQTQGQATVMLSDAPGPAGGILLQTAGGGRISITDDGITLSNGRGATLTLVGSTVTLNDGALVVT
jgi:Type VI secretion system/phage-baseplate injector OB domain